jgi:hypothetical protein
MTAPAAGSRWAAVGRGLRFAARYEAGLWAALAAWLTRRPLPLRPGETPFPYAQTVKMLLGVFIGLSALEIPVLHLLLPWQTARYVSLAIGAYGLIWMFGLWATLRRNPHTVGPAGLAVRNGITVAIDVPWDAVAEVRMRRRSMPPGGQTQVDADGDARVLSLGVQSQTSVDVLLRRPLTVGVAKTRGEPVTGIRLHADDPAALVAAAREQMAAGGRRAAHDH